MFLRGAHEGTRKILQAELISSLPRAALSRFSRLKWTSSLGSGFDGSSFSDEEDNSYHDLRNMRFGYGEPGSVTYKGNEDSMVDEFNKELESVFGSAAPHQLGTTPGPKPGYMPERQKLNREPTSLNNQVETPTGIQNVRKSLQQDSATNGAVTTVNHSNAVALSHVDSSGKAAMVNVATKTNTSRVAVASARVLLGIEAFSLVAANNIAKGDVLTVAKIAGIMGAKQTSALIPLCHPLMLSGVDISLTLNNELHAVDIEAKVSTVGVTGVEMEALTAVSVASLTVYDMCKAVSKDIRISDMCLESKTGGKSGDWHRQRNQASR